MIKKLLILISIIFLPQITFAENLQKAFSVECAPGTLKNSIKMKFHIYKDLSTGMYDSASEWERPKKYGIYQDSRGSDDTFQSLIWYRMTKLKDSKIGFVHQFFHLIPELTVLENIALPRMIKTNLRKESFKSATSLINKFNLSDRANFKPLKLSGGEQQRVAIARSLINNPQLVIADEMTGNLDEENADLIFDFFLNQIKVSNSSLIYVTHNHKYAEKADIQFKIQKRNLVKI